MEEFVLMDHSLIDSVTHHVEDKGQTEAKGKFENEGIEEPKRVQEELRKDIEIEAKKEQEEKKVRGLISKSTFIKYARSMGGWGVVMWILFLFALSQAVSLACIAMIGRWSERSLEDQVRCIAFLLVLPFP